MQLDRKEFLKLCVPASGVIIFGLPRFSTVAAPSWSSTQAGKAMLYDASRCVGCKACQNACKKHNNLLPESTNPGTIHDDPSCLSASTLTLIKTKEYIVNGLSQLLLCKYQCMHCTEAACVKVCPTSALTHDDLGFVAYDRDKCSGCGYCAKFCPFEVPQLDTSPTGIRGKMNKCDFCAERVRNNSATACAAACPAGALSFGNRDELVVEGRKRMEAMGARYPNATLYGADELRGLHVIYILPHTPEVYLLPRNPQIPPVAVAWQTILKPTGLVILALTIVGLALNYLVARAAVKLEKE